MKKKSSNEIDMENKLKILETIQRVEVSPFLYARILNTLENKKKEIVPIKWGWMAAACLLLVFTINIVAMQNNKRNTEVDLTKVFSLQPQNMFYNE